MITIDLRTRCSVSKPALTRFLRRAHAAAGLRGAVDVLLTSDTEVKRLNRSFRGKNNATDVLSFPAEPMPGLPEEHQHTGDLAISLETAGRQAEEHGHSLATELRILLLHGLLHLAGMDHETDEGEMAEREAELRRELRLPGSLIERSAAVPIKRVRAGLETPRVMPMAAVARRARPMQSEASGGSPSINGARSRSGGRR